jgi:hypothetical protein
MDCLFFCKEKCGVNREGDRGKKRKRGNQYIEEPRNDKWYTANVLIDIASCRKTINGIP